MKDNRYCLICRPKNRTIYFHKNEDGTIWLFCNKCDRGYSLAHYCKQAGVDLKEFLEGRFYFQEAQSNEVQAVSWPSSFIPLADPRSAKGVEYIKSRGLTTSGDMYYDVEEEGIVFPYYYENHFCGAQVRFLEPRVKEDGEPWKITTLPGTRLGLLFGGWNQAKLFPHIKAVVVCEGYFNALSLQQAFNIKYGGVTNNPWKFISTSGSGVSNHQAETLKDLRQQGYKVICAFDTDDAGVKGLKKMMDNEVLTHYSLTMEVGADWNDLLKRSGHADLAEIFLRNICKI